MLSKKHPLRVVPILEKKYGKEDENLISEDIEKIKSVLDGLDNLYPGSDISYLVPGKFNTTRLRRQISYFLTSDNGSLVGTLIIERSYVFQDPHLKVRVNYRGKPEVMKLMDAVRSELKQVLVWVL